jgi:Concanavalin A-like lectin/glucanases superfamily
MHGWWWIAGLSLLAASLVGCADVLGIEAGSVRGSGGAGGTVPNGGATATGGQGGIPLVPCTGSNYDEVVLGDGPEAYWRFEETVSNTGALNEVDPVDKFGSYGTSVVPDAMPLVAGSNSAVGLMTANDSLVNFGPIFDFTHEQDFTIELWLSLGDGQNEKHIFGRRATNIGYVLMHDGTSLQFFFQYAGVRMGPETTVLPGIGHHIVVTSREGELCIYRDTIQSPCVTITDPPQLPVGNLSIGLNGFYFQGIVDEAAVYTHALAPGQIQAHYDCGKVEGL